MALSDDQVVNSLLAYYKSRHLDLSFLLGDPTFQKMPVSVKIDFVKRSVKELADGVHSGFTTSERASITSGALMSALGGAGAAGWAMKGIEAASAVPFFKAKAATMGLAAVGAGALGAAAGYMRAAGQRDRRLFAKHELSILHRDPSDANAVGVLSAGITPGLTLKDILLQKIEGQVSARADGLGEHVGKTALPVLYGAYGGQ